MQRSLTESFGPWKRIGDRIAFGSGKRALACAVKPNDLTIVPKEKKQMRLFILMQFFLLLVSSLQAQEKTKGSEKKMEVKGIHYAIQVSDLKKATQYYGKAFDMKPSYELKGEVGFVITNGFSINLTEKKKVKCVTALQISGFGEGSVLKTNNPCFCSSDGMSWNHGISTEWALCG